MKQFKLFFAAAAMLSLAACTSEDLVNAPDTTVDNNGKAPAAMTFSVGQKNQTRAEVGLETVHNNFGVWAYKTVGTGTSATTSTVMPHYLVGWGGEGGYDPTSATTKPTTGDPSNPSAGTLADQTYDNLSWWFYEGLGKDYSSTTTGYEASSPSVNDHQFLKFWDMSAASYDFYAYSPYDQDTEYSDGVLTFNNIWGLMDKEHSERMYAQTNIESYGYGNDVPLSFKHLNGSVRMAFYELIDGYDVQIDKVNVQTAKLDADNKVMTTGAVITVGGDYDIDFTKTPAEVTPKNLKTNLINQDFDKPNGTEVAANATTGQVKYNKIADERDDCVSGANSQSPSTYYCLPANTEAGKGNDGFIVTIDFTIYSKDTDESIKIEGAQVFVASDYTQWKSNTKYLYVFRITKDAKDGDDNPLLKPIVFDGIAVSDYDTTNSTPAPNDYDWVISADTNPDTNPNP